MLVAGTCSFCGKEQVRVFGAAARICGECVAMSCDIIARDFGLRPDPKSSSLEAAAYRDLVTEVLRRAAAQREALETAQRAGPRPPWFGPDAYACSFCGTGRREVVKLVSGPRVFICDRCIAGAVAQFVA